MNWTTPENIVELDGNLVTLMAETHIDAHENVVARVEAEAEADIALQMLEIEVRLARIDFACIAKDRHVESTKDLPAIFGIHDQRIVSAKTERPEFPQIVRTAEHGLHIERQRTVTICEGRLRFGPQSDYAALVEKRNILLDFQVQTAEAVQTEASIAEVMK